MTAQAWTVYNNAKEILADSNTLDLDAAGWKIALFKNSSNAGTKTISTYGSLTNEVDNTS